MLPRRTKEKVVIMTSCGDCRKGIENDQSKRQRNTDWGSRWKRQRGLEIKKKTDREADFEA